MIVSIAVVQPETFRGDREQDNLLRATAAIKKAADQGAQLVVFPEGYPGPYSGPLTYSPLEALWRAGKRVQRSCGSQLDGACA